jgi:hypothetical protein
MSQTDSKKKDSKTQSDILNTRYKSVEELTLITLDLSQSSANEDENMLQYVQYLIFEKQAKRSLSLLHEQTAKRACASYH